MRSWRILLALFLTVSVAAVGYGQTSVIKSTVELRRLGIAVERLRHDTPMASVEIGSMVEPGKAGGEYDHTECVVLSGAVDPEKLALAEAGSLDSVTVVRRSESSKARSIFLVLGRDVKKSYLAFQFTQKTEGATKTVRYLFPLSQVRSSAAQE